MKRQPIKLNRKIQGWRVPSAPNPLSSAQSENASATSRACSRLWRASEPTAGLALFVRVSDADHFQFFDGVICPIRNRISLENQDLNVPSAQIAFGKHLRGDTDLGRFRAAISGADYAHRYVNGAETQKPRCADRLHNPSLFRRASASFRLIQPLEL